VNANFTRVRSLRGIGPATSRVQCAFCRIETLDGIEDVISLEHLSVPFNFVRGFEACHSETFVRVLDLNGNPLKSLVNCPPCEVLQIAATHLKNLDGIPRDRVRVVRCGHSSYLQNVDALLDCPKLEVLNIADAPNVSGEVLEKLRARGVEVRDDGWAGVARSRL
jgi:hypothetical protein